MEETQNQSASNADVFCAATKKSMEETLKTTKDSIRLYFSLVYIFYMQNKSAFDEELHVQHLSWPQLGHPQGVMGFIFHNTPK